MLIEIELWSVRLNFSGYKFDKNVFESVGVMGILQLEFRSSVVH